MNIQIRKALKIEIEWINEKYDEVQFIHSNFENEIIAIAEINQVEDNSNVTNYLLYVRKRLCI